MATGSRLLVFAVAFAAAALDRRRTACRGTGASPTGAEVFTDRSATSSTRGPTGTASGTSRSPRAATPTATAAPRSSPSTPCCCATSASLFGGNLLATGIVISLVCFAGCVWLLYRLVRARLRRRRRVARRRLPGRSARSPSSCRPSTPSRSSCCSRWPASCAPARDAGGSRASRGCWPRSPAAPASCCSCRCSSSTTSSATGLLRRTDGHVVNLLLIPEGLLVWMTYLSLTFGKPLLFADAQAQWQRVFAAPNYAVARGIVAAVQGLRQMRLPPVPRPVLGGPAAGRRPTAWRPPTSSTSPSSALAGLLLCYGARRLPRAYSCTRWRRSPTRSSSPRATCR